MSQQQEDNARFSAAQEALIRAGERLAGHDFLEMIRILEHSLDMAFVIDPTLARDAMQTECVDLLKKAALAAKQLAEHVANWHAAVQRAQIRRFQRGDLR